MRNLSENVLQYDGSTSLISRPPRSTDEYTKYGTLFSAAALMKPFASETSVGP